MTNRDHTTGDQNPLQRSFISEEDSSPADPYPFEAVDDSTQTLILVSLLGLQSIKGIGYKTLCSMFDTGLLTDFWDLDYAEFVRRWQRLETKTSAEIPRLVVESKREIERNGQRAIKELSFEEISFAAFGHSTYPEKLKKLQEPPRWLFVKGTLEALHQDAIVAIVGTRKPSIDGERLSYRTAQEFAKRNVVVLSGLAKGIDQNAHLGAVDNFGVSIAVLGHGISAAYASVNQKLWNALLRADGAIVSEYMPGDPPSRDRFLRRNELQVALSRVVIPIEAPSLQSGTGATIRRARAIGVPIIGVIPSGTRVKSLVETKHRLMEIDVPVFEVMGENSRELWDYLAGLIPNHAWDEDPTSRQDRFLKSVEETVISEIGKVDLDEQAIDRLAERLKEAIREKRRIRGNDTSSSE